MFSKHCSKSSNRNAGAHPTCGRLVDGINRRIGKKVNGTLERAWLYKDGLNPVVELDGTGTVISRFVYSGRANVPDFIIKGGVTYKVISDHLGSPRVVVDSASGIVIQSIVYDEWGNVITDTNPGFQPFGFAGGLYDLDTKLVRFGARDYDAQVGRWASKDPIRFNSRDTNLYGYVFLDPVNFVDLGGLDALTIGVVFGYGGTTIEFGFVLFDGTTTNRDFDPRGLDLGVFGTIKTSVKIVEAGRTPLCPPPVLSLGVSRTLGCRSNFEGQDSEFSTGFGLWGFSASGITDGIDGNESLGVSVGLQPIGVQGQVTGTGAFTIGDLARGIGKLISGRKEPFHGSGAF